MSKSRLKYTDSHDHCLGIVGMAIALYAFDCSEFLISISLEEGQQDIVLTDDFLFFSSDDIDPSELQRYQVDYFKVYCGMTFSNYFCRRYCANRTPNVDALQQLEEHVCNIASTQIGLAEADARQITHDVQHSLHQIFTRHLLVNTARDFAKALLDKKEMSQEEVDKHLSLFLE